MTTSLRIVVADDEPDMREYFQKCLARLGHQIVAVACDGRELIEKCRSAAPDLVITDIRMPELDGINAAEAIQLERPVPVILVSAYHDAELIARASADHIQAYLVKPIKQVDLGPTIALALRRFRELQALRQETAKLREDAEEQLLIDRARTLIITHAHVDETEASRRLQQLADEQHRPLKDVARTIVGTEHAFDPSPLD